MQPKKGSKAKPSNHPLLLYRIRNLFLLTFPWTIILQRIVDGQSGGTSVGMFRSLFLSFCLVCGCVCLCVCCVCVCLRQRWRHVHGPTGPQTTNHRLRTAGDERAGLDAYDVSLRRVVLCGVFVLCALCFVHCVSNVCLLDDRL